MSKLFQGIVSDFAFSYFKNMYICIESDLSHKFIIYYWSSLFHIPPRGIYNLCDKNTNRPMLCPRPPLCLGLWIYMAVFI